MSLHAAGIKELLCAFDPCLPLSRAKTIPASWYFDDSLAALERRALFQITWQLVARAEQLEAVGAFVTADIAGEPIAVVRGDDGILRAFSNVCRHRAARVLEQEEGCASRLRCRYHGWTYDLRGQLRGTPEFEGVENFARGESGLPPLSVDSYGPWVFVKASNGNEKLADALAPLPTYLPQEATAGLEFVQRRAYDLDCNWKVYVDNYLDGGYHVNTVHPGLAGVIDYSGYRSELFASASVQLSPLRPPDPANAGVASVRSGDMAQYWWIFPNLMINAYQDVLDVNIIVPLGTERCRVIFDFYFSPRVDADARNQSMDVAEQVQREDMAICEEVQKGLRSSHYNTGRFSVKREATGYHFHQLLANRLGRAFGDH